MTHIHYFTFKYVKAAKLSSVCRGTNTAAQCRRYKILVFEEKLSSVNMLHRNRREAFTWCPSPVVLCYHIHTIDEVFPKFLQVAGLRQAARYSSYDDLIHVYLLQTQRANQ